FVKGANRAMVGHSEGDVSGVPDRPVREVGYGQRHASVRGAPHVQRINVAFAPVVRPTVVNRGTVIRVDVYRKRRTDALLPQGRRIGPWDRNALNHNPPRQFVRWILQRLERIGSCSSCVVTDNDYIAGRDGAVKFSPAKEGCVNGIVGSDGRAN